VQFYDSENGCLTTARHEHDIIKLTFSGIVSSKLQFILLCVSVGQITLVCEAKGYYKIKGSVAKKLSKFYSSFRAVLGDGECFYRSFIYSYLVIFLAL
jgi:hypothetical protein